ncbi:hypothetical protein PINS_up013342 [Pythium insidiosum]|nr:hypothetical protein PINS_up013342 [Pythium insidiosum]
MMDTISGGCFLLTQPLERGLKGNADIETEWFSSLGYFTLAQLIVNQIELSIWTHWVQRSKSPGHRIPVQGVASKKYIIQEWEHASNEQHYISTKVIGKEVISYLNQIGMDSFQQGRFVEGPKAQLATLLEVIECGSLMKQGQKRIDAVKDVFSCSLSQTASNPHAAAVWFLVAEMLQDQCAKMLSERVTVSTASPRPVDGQSVTNHAQRRRTARKRLNKQKKREVEIRLQHHDQFKPVLVDLLREVRRREENVVAAVQQVLAGMVDSLASSEVHQTIDVPAIRSKRRKKRGKKKSTAKQMSAPADANSFAMAKENHAPNSVGSEQVAATSSKKRDRDMEHDQVGTARSPDARPLFGFLSGADRSFVSPQPAPFAASSFYPMCSPLFLQLAESPFKEDEEDDVKPHGATMLQGAATEPTFDWYLPPLFSSQSSAHTSSTASSIDWDFANWSSKPELPNPKARHSKSHTVVNRPSKVNESGDEFSLGPITTLLDLHEDQETSDGVRTAYKTEAKNVQQSEDDRSDFLYREGGFFDRQRASKRLRRPFPFECKSDNDNGDPDEHEKPNGIATTNNSEQAGTSASNAEEPQSEASPLADDVATLKDRLLRLEVSFSERSKADDSSSPVSNISLELSSLRQTVTSLENRVIALESTLHELKVAGNNRKHDAERPVNHHETLYEHVNGQDGATVEEQSNSPQQEAHDVSPDQVYAHPTISSGAPAHSVLGPFVSVPMSVLPPRSKLHWDMCEFVSQLQTESNARLSAQMAAIRYCTAAVQSLWPRAQVRPYGSFVTRLALPTSDVDLVICLPKVRRDAPADAAGVLEGRNAIKESWQQNLARKLCQEQWVVQDSVKTIPHAAIPIITLVTKLPFNIRLDISFEGPGHNGLATNNVVFSMIHEFPALAPIMLVLKSFVIERGFAVAYSGGLSSYALLLMVARYLQDHTDRMPRTYDDGSGGYTSCADFGMVLMGLLDYYGNRFDPRTTGISVASRCFLDRETMSPSAASREPHVVGEDVDMWQGSPSSSMHSSNLLSSPGSRRYGNRTSLHDWPHRQQVVDQAHDPHKFDPIFIEDPLRPSNNVGRNCFRIMQIRRAFAAGYSTLMEASMSSSVFLHNRNTLIGGVALHPDNILRSILGSNAPTTSKTDSAGVARPPVDATMTKSVLRYQYRHAPPYGPHVFDHRLPQAIGAPYFHADVSPTPPYMLHRMSIHAPPATTTPTKTPSKSYRHDHSTYRRHSGSVSEKMTTRSEVASAEKYYKRKRDRIVSPRLAPLSMHRSNSSEIDINKLDDNSSAPRKCPTRSMSFADVVIGGKTSEHSRKGPASPLALVRSSRPWRDDTAIDDSLNEKLETKDDFELK